MLKGQNVNIQFIGDAFRSEVIQHVIDSTVIVNDHWSFFEPKNKNVMVYSYPGTLLKDYFWGFKKFKSLQFFLPDVKHSVNLICNKKQMSRFLALKLVEFFSIDSDYFWSGVGSTADLSLILNEITPAQSALLAPLHVQPRWFYDTSQCDLDSLIHLSHGGDHSWSWNHGLGEMVSSTAVSIITESHNDLDRACSFSWKTMASVLGLTFPIWVGTYASPYYWKRLGFDIFEDVIDHSYQYCPSFFQRCWDAFEKNKILLADRDKLVMLKTQYHHRLIKNRDRLLNGDFVQTIHADFLQWPTWIQQFALYSRVGPLAK